MTSELKPCPFCGCEPIKQHNENKNHHSYECSSEESKKLCCMIMPMTHIYDSEKEAAHAWNTRAVPDMPELVRYQPIAVTWDDGSPKTTEMVVSKEGEYVRYDQADAVIADERQAAIDARNLLQYEKDQQWQDRAEAAEAKLTQINDQKPVAYTLIFSKHYGVNAETTFKTFEAAEKYAARCELPLSSIIPLYAAPVASDAELRAENDRYKQALEFYANISPISYDFGHTAKAALNPSEPRT